MIPVFRPSSDRAEIESVTQVIESGWWGLGPKTSEFESKFAEYVSARHAVAMNSATASLHLGLMLFGIRDKEVITTSMTFVSTNHAILYNGGIPVFADIEADTLNLDPDDIARKVTPRTGAIVVVHYGGHPCDMDRIRAIAQHHGIPVLEDAAHACGASYKGRRIGSISEATSFSFHAVKNLATGDGGMVTTNDPAYDKRLRRLRWLGINKDTWSRSDDGHNYSWAYNVEELGFKCHMNDLTAAIGLAQLARLDERNARRRAIAARYTEAFRHLGWLETPVEKDYASSSWHNYVIKVETASLHALSGGEWRQHRDALHSESFVRMYRPYASPLPVTEQVWTRLVTLPLFPGSTDEEVDYIVDKVLVFGKQAA